ncbi:MAG: alpha/beta hydrolase fold domain-containing protein [Solirubrobacterales bacterium]|nr:alpha/beta hydrolase fold domain-containing protein [Solirubrobacterales bacterium]
MNRTRWLLIACGVPVLLVVLVLLAGALAPKSDQPPAPTTTTATPPPSNFTPGTADRVNVGRGVQGAAIFRPSDGSDPDAPVVVFLHGWAAIDAAFYGPWIDHLVRRGTTVVYPTYQEPPFLDTATPLPNVLIALRLAFAELQVKPERLVVAGHSAGGALAADYAASARAAGMPEPASVFSVYPGRAIGDVPAQLKPVDAKNIAPGTRVLVYGGARDRLVGTRSAREIARTATRANTTLRVIREAGVADHAAPARATPDSRRVFWEPLDQLVDATG